MCIVYCPNRDKILYLETIGAFERNEFEVKLKNAIECVRYNI